MKKKLVSIISFLIATIMCVSVSGCKLVTKNDTRDIERTVATVKIADNVPQDTITKKDMMVAYMNYGYYYAYQGYTNERVFRLIINNLVNSRILVQDAMIKFDKGEAPFDKVYKNPAITDKFNVERYLDEDAMIDVNYDTIKAMNNLIANYVVKDEEETYTDTITTETRTVPTGAENDEEVSKEEKIEYIAKGVDKGDNDPKIRNAYIKVIAMLEENNMLGDDYDTTKKNIEDTIYYKDTLKTEEENEIVEIYENCIKDSARKGITFDDLIANYKAMYDAQVSDYTASASDFSSALSSATAEKPIVYSPYSGYGYVYNLLLGADDIEKAQIEALTGTTEKKTEDRKQILSGITAKDLRSTWILAGYDFDYETKKFTGDYTFAEDAANSLAFNGNVERIKEADKENDKKAQYRVSSSVLGLDEFIDYMDEYVYGSKMPGTEVATGANYKIVKYTGDIEEYDNKIQELLFAYSTDPGSLNTYKGYVISPAPATGEAETYVQDFADAGRKLLDMGGRSYIIVGTDYGYHVMFFSEILNVDTDYDSLIKYLNHLYGVNEDKAYWEGVYNDLLADWNDPDVDKDHYLYKLIDLYSSSTVTSTLSETETSVISTYKNDTNYVNIYKDVYADLLTD